MMQPIAWYGLPIASRKDFTDMEIVVTGLTVLLFYLVSFICIFYPTEVIRLLAKLAKSLWLLPGGDANDDHIPPNAKDFVKRALSEPERLTIFVLYTMLLGVIFLIPAIIGSLGFIAMLTRTIGW
jgi:hypothetical protein